MDCEDLLKLVKERRSVRRFKPDPVPDEYIEKIIEVARWAPSGNNCQPWEFIVVKNPELRKKIADQILASSAGTNVRRAAERNTAPGGVIFVGTPAGYTNAQAFIILCGDDRMRETMPASTSYESVTLMLNSSLTCAFFSMTLAATTLGLGCQWVSAIRTNPENERFTKELLGIPEELKFYAMLALGFPAVTPAPRMMRPKEEMLQYDYYDKSRFRTLEQARDFIRVHRLARKEELIATYGHQPDV
ncbi:MAG: nitroreductase family protein [Chloroflexi bacterium]|nr:nitroreductase family protein [Chloroflexota bacterium]